MKTMASNIDEIWKVYYATMRRLADAIEDNQSSNFSSSSDFTACAKELLSTLSTINSRLTRLSGRLTQEKKAGTRFKLRIMNLANLFYSENREISDDSLNAYFTSTQTCRPLTLTEISIAIDLVMLLHIEGIFGPENIQHVTRRENVDKLRALAFLDVDNFIETQALAHPAEIFLRRDPATVYRAMNVATRDSYREAVMQISSIMDASPQEVMTKILSQCSAHADDYQMKHVGYYLFEENSALVAKKPKVIEKFLFYFRKIVYKNREPLYLTFLFCFSAVFVNIVLHFAATEMKVFEVIVVIFIYFPLTSYLTITIFDFFGTEKSLPQMQYKEIPEQLRCAVVLPVKISNSHSVDLMCEALEKVSIEHSEKNVYFWALTDFSDCATLDPFADKLLQKYLAEKICELNGHLSALNRSCCTVLHRNRIYNRRDAIWMGHERKRGKLNLLNQWLTSDIANPFTCIGADLEESPYVRYVIVMDLDSRLVSENGLKHLIEIAAHPLNSPSFDRETGRVGKGFSIIQPDLRSRGRGNDSSLYQILGCDEPYWDSRPLGLSSFFLDFFGESTYFGKGLYDLLIFAQVMNRSFPDNLILSHDLVEGCLARVAVAKDVILEEDYPATYHSDIKRRHRWMRGDWQNFLFALGFSSKLALLPGEKTYWNKVSLLSKWKIIDSVRRNISPIFILMAFVLSMSINQSVDFIALACFPSLIIPFISAAKETIQAVNFYFLGKIDGCGLIRFVTNIVSKTACKSFIFMVFIPYEAYLSASAIMTSSYRVFVSRKNILEWAPFSNHDSGRARLSFSYQILFYAKLMWFAPALALTLAIIAIASHRDTTLLLLFLSLWFLCPVVAGAASMPKFLGWIIPSRQKASRMYPKCRVPASHKLS